MASRTAGRAAARLTLALVLAGCSAGQASPPTVAPSAPPAAGSTSPAPSPAPTAAPTTGAPSTAAPSTAAPSALPLGDRLVATITTDTRPCAMAASRTAVWVTSFGGSVDRIAPATNTVSKRYQIGGSPCGIGIDGRGMIWIAVLGTGRVVSLDPTTGKVVHTIPDLGPDLWDLKVRGDDVWVVDRSARQLLRISAATAAVTLRVPIGPSGAGLALVHDRIWVADNVDGKLRSVDPGTGEVLATIEAGGAPTWFVDDGVSTLAIADQASGTVARVDPASGTLGPPVGGWIQPLDGTVIGGDAWVPDGAARVVRVLDLSAGAVTASWTLPDAVRPFVAEPAFGDVWILDAAGTNVWRIRP